MTDGLTTILRGKSREQNQRPRITVVVGIDGTPASQYALDFVCDLKCSSEQHYVMANAVESLEWVEGDIEQRGIEMLDAAVQRVTFLDPLADECQMHGDAAEVLLRVADEEKADLIVVGHNRRGAIEDFVLGSVAKDILHRSSCHVLIARPPVAPVVDLNLVVAADDSEESATCIDELIRIGPTGIQKTYVVTVKDAESASSAMLVRGLPHLKDKASQWVALGLQKDSERLCDRLIAGGFDAEPLVVDGRDAAEAIGQACDATRSSLIVVAARPHGFLDRLIHGSVSEAIFSKDSRSLLVLRP